MSRVSYWLSLGLRLAAVAMPGAVLVLGGCTAGTGGSGLPPGEGAGANGAGNGTGNSAGISLGGGTGGVPDNGCSEAAKLVYVIDENNVFYSFDPTIQSPAAFHAIGTPNCGSGGGPNSMAVSREGFAYVLYGEPDSFYPDVYYCNAVNKIDITTAACIGPTPFQCGTQSFDKFGMGYATDAQNSDAETLYLGNSLAAALASLDVTTGALTPHGTLPNQGPEFTGNANAELWGFFPYESPPAAININKSNGAALTSLPLSSLPDMSQGSSAAWAFAYWGGSFYIFYMVSPPDDSTNVYKLEYDGTVTEFIPNTGLVIVGAGVSTCAPVVPPN